MNMVPLGRGRQVQKTPSQGYLKNPRDSRSGFRSGSLASSSSSHISRDGDPKLDFNSRVYHNFRIGHPELDVETQTTSVRLPSKTTGEEVRKIIFAALKCTWKSAKYKIQSGEGIMLDGQTELQLEDVHKNLFVYRSDVEAGFKTTENAVAVHGIRQVTNAGISNFTALTEFVENAIQKCLECGTENPTVTIVINTRERCLEINDNGVGASRHQIEKIQAVGGGTNRSLRDDNGVEIEARGRQLEHLTGRIGKYGIGRNAFEKFGEQAKMTTRTKTKGSLKVHTFVDDAGGSVDDTLKYEVTTGDCDPAEKEESYWKVKIENVSQSFFTEWSLNKKKILKKMSERYHFYLHGMDELQSRLNTLQDGSQLCVNRSFKKLKIIVRDMTGHDRYDLAVVPDPGENDVKRFFEKIDVTSRPFYLPIILKVKSGPGGQDLFDVPCELVLFYFPVLNGGESMPSLYPHDTNPTLKERKPGIQVVWQNVIFSEEGLKENSRMLWFMQQLKGRGVMKKFKESKIQQLSIANKDVSGPLHRVKGFLFVNDAFTPSIHKDSLNPNGAWEVLNSQREIRIHGRWRDDDWVTFSRYNKWIVEQMKKDVEVICSDAEAEQLHDASPFKWKKMTFQSQVYEIGNFVCIIHNREVEIGKILSFQTLSFRGNDKPETLIESWDGRRLLIPSLDIREKKTATDFSTFKKDQVEKRPNFIQRIEVDEGNHKVTTTTNSTERVGSQERTVAFRLLDKRKRPIKNAALASLYRVHLYKFIDGEYKQVTDVGGISHYDVAAFRGQFWINHKGDASGEFGRQKLGKHQYKACVTEKHSAAVIHHLEFKITVEAGDPEHLMCWFDSEEIKIGKNTYKRTDTGRWVSAANNTELPYNRFVDTSTPLIMGSSNLLNIAVGDRHYNIVKCPLQNSSFNPSTEMFKLSTEVEMRTDLRRQVSLKVDPCFMSPGHKEAAPKFSITLQTEKKTEPGQSLSCALSTPILPGSAHRINILKDINSPLLREEEYEMKVQVFDAWNNLLSLEDDAENFKVSGCLELQGCQFEESTSSMTLGLTSQATWGRRACEFTLSYMGSKHLGTCDMEVRKLKISSSALNFASGLPILKLPSDAKPLEGLRISIVDENDVVDRSFPKTTVEVECGRDFEHNVTCTKGQSKTHKIRHTTAELLEGRKRKTLIFSAEHLEPVECVLEAVQGKPTLAKVHGFVLDPELEAVMLGSSLMAEVVVADCGGIVFSKQELSAKYAIKFELLKSKKIYFEELWSIDDADGNAPTIIPGQTTKHVLMGFSEAVDKKNGLFSFGTHKGAGYTLVGDVKATTSIKVRFELIDQASGERIDESITTLSVMPGRLKMVMKRSMDLQHLACHSLDKLGKLNEYLSFCDDYGNESTIFNCKFKLMGSTIESNGVQFQILQGENAAKAKPFENVTFEYEKNKLKWMPKKSTFIIKNVNGPVSEPLDLEVPVEGCYRRKKNAKEELLSGTLKFRVLPSSLPCAIQFARKKGRPLHYKGSDIDRIELEAGEYLPMARVILKGDFSPPLETTSFKLNVMATDERGAALKKHSAAKDILCHLVHRRGTKFACSIDKFPNASWNVGEGEYDIYFEHRTKTAKTDSNVRLVVVSGYIQNVNLKVFEGASKTPVEGDIYVDKHTRLRIELCPVDGFGKESGRNIEGVTVYSDVEAVEMRQAMSESFGLFREASPLAVNEKSFLLELRPNEDKDYYDESVEINVNVRTSSARVIRNSFLLRIRNDRGKETFRELEIRGLDLQNRLAAITAELKSLEEKKKDLQLKHTEAKRKWENVSGRGRANEARLTELKAQKARLGNPVDIKILQMAVWTQESAYDLQKPNHNKLRTAMDTIKSRSGADIFGLTTDLGYTRNEFDAKAIARALGPTLAVVCKNTEAFEKFLQDEKDNRLLYKAGFRINVKNLSESKGRSTQYPRLGTNGYIELPSLNTPGALPEDLSPTCCRYAVNEIVIPEHVLSHEKNFRLYGWYHCLQLESTIIFNREAQALRFRRFHQENRVRELSKTMLRCKLVCRNNAEFLMRPNGSVMVGTVSQIPYSLGSAPPESFPEIIKQSKTNLEIEKIVREIGELEEEKVSLATGTLEKDLQGSVKQLNHELCESMDSIKKLKAEKLAIMQTAKQHEQASGNNRKRKAPSERQVLDKGKRGRR